MCSCILSARACAPCPLKECCFCMCGWDRQSDLARWNPFPNMSANAIESKIFLFPSGPLFIVTCPFLGSLHSEHRRPTGPAIRQNRQLPRVGHPAALLCLQMLVSAPPSGTQRRFIGRTTSSSLMHSPHSSTLVKFLITCGPFKHASIARWSLLASEVASSSCMLICMILLLLLLLLLSLLFSKAADLSQKRDLAPPRKDQK